jgi:CheY-like chemotaxis protein
MNIDFCVLCIDDDSDFTEQLNDELTEVIRSHNLLPKIDAFKEYSQEKAKKIGNKYDLILVDYNLPNRQVGTEIISRIRKSSMLPDIIFYSSVSTIDEIIQKEKQENRESLLEILQKGIYFSDAHNLFLLAEQVINKIITREEKINGFRGIVLSFVSEYETLVNDIIDRALQIMTDYSKIDKYIEHDILGEIKDKAIKEFDKFNQNESIVKSKEVTSSENRHLDHSKRVRIMNRILNEIGQPDFEVEKYNQDIIKMRNALGHISITQDGENQYYTFVVDSIITQLTPDFCNTKRKELLEWKLILTNILQKMEQ